jgi:phage-related protein
VAGYGALRIGVLADLSGFARDVSKAAVGTGLQAGTTIAGNMGKGISGAGAKLGQGIGNAFGKISGKVLGEGLGGKIGNALGNALGKTGAVIGKGMDVAWKVIKGGAQIAAPLVKGAATAIGTASIAAIGFGISAFKTAARIGEMNATLKALATANGVSEKAVFGAVRSVKAMGITTGVAQQTVAQFVRSNLDLSQASKLARVAQDAAVVGNKDSSETLETLIDGITRGNTLILKNAGLNIDARQAYNRYAESIGRTANSLTPAEKQQALFNAVMQEGGKYAGAYAAAMEEPGKVLRSFPRLFESIKESVGTGLLNAFKPVILNLYHFTSSFAEAVGEGGKLRPIIDAITSAVGRLAGPIGTFVQRMADWLKNVPASRVKEIADAIGRFAKPLGAVVGLSTVFTGGGILGKLPVVGGLFQNMGGAIGGAGKAAVAVMGPWSILAGAVAGLTVGTKEGRKALKDTSVDLTKTFGGAIKSVGPQMGGLKKTFGELGKAIGPPVVKAIGDIAKGFAPAVPLIVSLAASLGRNLVPVFKTLGPILGEIGQKLGKALGDGFRSLQTVMPAVNVAFGVLGTVIRGLMVFLKPLVQVILDLVGWLSKGPMSYVIMAIAAAIGVWAAAQWLLNVAMNANPIGLIILGIVALGAVIAFIIKRFDVIKNAFATAFNFMLGIFKTVWNFIKTNWPLLLPIILGPVGIIAAVVIKNFGTIKNFIMSVVSAVMGFLSSAWNAIRGVAIAVWNAIRVGVMTPVNAIRNGVMTAFNVLRSGVSGVFNAIRSVAMAVWNGIRSAVMAVVNGLRSGVMAVFNGLRAGVSAVFSAFRTILVAPFNAARAGISAAINGIKSVVNTIAGGVRSAVSGLTAIITAPFNAAKAAVETAINAIKRTVETVFNTIKSTVNVVLSPLRGILGAIGKVGFEFKLPGWIPGIGGKGFSLKLPDFSGSIPKLQAGGYVNPGPQGMLALIGEAGRERVQPLEASGMTPAEERSTALLAQVVRILRQGTTVEIDGQAIATALSAQTLYGVAS